MREPERSLYKAYLGVNSRKVGTSTVDNPAQLKLRFFHISLNENNNLLGRMQQIPTDKGNLRAKRLDDWCVWDPQIRKCILLCR